MPGDKSISHRAIMFGALGEGRTRIRGALMGADCLSTLEIFRKMGVRAEIKEGEILVEGAGLYGLKEPEGILDCGNSGTTMRLSMGILSAMPFDCVLTGDASLRSRPMGRVIRPLTEMGAVIEGEKDDKGKETAPLRLQAIKGRLKGISYESPVASAQVKSAILLAGLFADGPTTVSEPALSRDHTERMLSALGARVERGKDEASGRPFARIYPAEKLYSMDQSVPGDISSAAYFMAAASLVPGSELLLENVGINPTRDGFIKVLKAMGGDLSLEDLREEAGEPCADILVRYAPLHGTVIEGELIPTLIDELPLAAVLGALAEGETIVRDAAELKVKESDRITAMTAGLSAMGADIESAPDGWVIRGRAGAKRLKGTEVDSFLDHRIAMSLAVASLCADGETIIRHPDCVRISFPDFFRYLELLKK